MGLSKRDYVLIPVYKRPAFLYVTLECITKNPGWQDLYYLFVVDYDDHPEVRGYDPGVIGVINDFLHTARGKFVLRQDKGFTLGKQSYNVLAGYALAAEATKEFVYMIEEDVFVANDFFRWHQTVHSLEPDIFCSIGTKNNCSSDPVTGHYDQYYLRGGDYQSLGVCWHKDMLLWALDHIEDWYFTNPIEYCAIKFPDSAIGNTFAEQDGLIRRILEKSGLQVAWPHAPRGYHAGFEGKNRNGKKPLPRDFNQQLEIIRAVAFDLDKMQAVSDFYQDSVPVSLESPEWQTLQLSSL